MSLEDKLDDLIAVIRQGFSDIEVTLRLMSDQPKLPVETRPNGHDAPVPAPTPLPPPVAEPVVAKGPSFDEVTAIAQEVARLKTPPVAIKLINQHGADRLANLPPEKYASFYAAAEILLGKQDAL